MTNHDESDLHRSPMLYQLSYQGDYPRSYIGLSGYRYIREATKPEVEKGEVHMINKDKAYNIESDLFEIPAIVTVRSVRINNIREK